MEASTRNTTRFQKPRSHDPEVAGDYSEPPGQDRGQSECVTGCHGFRDGQSDVRQQCHPGAETAAVAGDIDHNNFRHFTKDSRMVQISDPEPGDSSPQTSSSKVKTVDGTSCCQGVR